jgi:hypothetical protein
LDTGAIGTDEGAVARRRTPLEALDDIIRSKRAANRPGDRAVLETLEKAREELAGAETGSGLPE